MILFDSLLFDFDLRDGKELILKIEEEIFKKEDMPKQQAFEHFQPYPMWCVCCNMKTTFNLKVFLAVHFFHGWFKDHKSFRGFT